MSNKFNPKEINDLIRSRKAVFPAMYTIAPIDKIVIKELLENANWAPNHKKTEPWRFKVFRGKGRGRLADFLASTYQQITPVEQFSEKKFSKLSQNPRKADTIIAIILHRDPEKRIPEWEEVAAVACAVQNMWLSCTAYGLGCYWSSPSIVQHLSSFLNLQENERCLGLFYIANHTMPEVLRERNPIADKVEWIEE